MNLLEQNRPKIDALCEKYSVQTLFVFGSVLNGQFSSDSDIDLLVEFDWSQRRNFSDCYWGLKESLENLFLCKVDLVCDSAIRNPLFRKEVDLSKEAIYAA